MIGVAFGQYAIGSVEQISLDEVALQNVLLSGITAPTGSVLGIRSQSATKTGYRLQTISFIGRLKKWT